MNKNYHGNNLSKSEGDTIKQIVDVIVVLSGGKPWFGGK